MEDIDAAFFRGLTRENEVPQANLPGQAPNSNQPPPPPGTTPPAPSTGVTLSGLLGAIDGVAAQEGRLLFATTNKYAALDPALTRPGRLDVHVRFDFAGKWQVEELFRCFFPPRAVIEEHLEDYDHETPVADTKSDRTSVGTATPSDSPASGSRHGADATDDKAGDKRGGGHLDKSPAAIFTVDTGAHCPPLTRDQVDHLALLFAGHIPDREFSMAAIQGLLMQYKTRPFDAVKDADAWVEAERKKKKDRDGDGTGDSEEAKKKKKKEEEAKDAQKKSEDGGEGGYEQGEGDVLNTLELVLVDCCDVKFVKDHL